MTERSPRAWATIFVVAVILSGCAQVGRPPGGPVDDTPPTLLSVSPESLAVGVASDAELRFGFSEKVDRRGVSRALRLIPDVELRRPRFEDLDVVFRPLRSWPADTVVVWTLDASLSDKHRVKMKSARSGAFTTGPRFPVGRIVGRAAVRDSSKAKWVQLRAQLSLPPPEGSRRATLWREGRADRRGRFSLDWLDPDSGPYRLQVFLDSNGDGRLGDQERVAELDSLRVAAGDTILDLGELLLLDRQSPVQIVFCVSPEEFSSRVWVMPEDEENETQVAGVDSTGCARFSLAPGPYRWGAWLDRDGDGKWGVDSTGVIEAVLEPTHFTVEPELPDTLRFEGAWAKPDSADGRVPAMLRAEQP